LRAMLPQPMMPHLTCSGMTLSSAFVAKDSAARCRCQG